MPKRKAKSSRTPKMPMDGMPIMGGKMPMKISEIEKMMGLKKKVKKSKNKKRGKKA